MIDLTKITPISAEPFEFGPKQTKWLEALESGNWQQGKRELKSLVSFQGNPDEPVQHKYCCLGVLCEIEGLKWKDTPFVGIGFQYGGDVNHYNSYPPSEFTQSIGLRQSNGVFKESIPIDEHYYESLGHMNDCPLQDFTFKDIAAYIRHDPHNVFTHSA